ncbi:hypothetical protein OG21DRAFT_1607754 [Imleria badia]|nr:hypothetical protein OG21DRAFT_1607754 [Imleria badia]
MNAPGIQEALAAAQKVASIMASSGNPFPHPTSSGSLDGESTTVSSVSDSETLLSARSSISTSPSSPGSASSFSWLNFNVNCNIISNTDSNAHGFNINNNVSENNG